MKSVRASFIVGVAALGIGPAALADLTVTSVSATARAQARAQATGYDLDSFDVTQTFTSIGFVTGFGDDVVSHMTIGDGQVSAFAQYIPAGISLGLHGSGSASLWPGDFPGGASGGGSADLTIQINLSTPQPLLIAGTFQTTGGLGHGPFGDGYVEIYDGAGTRLGLFSGASGGSLMNFFLPSAVGTYKIIASGHGGASDQGGGGFTGGSAAGGADFTITTVPAPGTAVLFAPALAWRRRRRCT